MLDTETKRSIDAARNILVGKVPDPKAQVEQITTALIYKFMDDMDKESQELGGKARFFAKGFEKYSWSKLLDRRLSGAGRLDLYRQAIANMSKNPHLPQLFRDIFKGAFLPYNDPETLSLFLKEINGFIYDHSENLGNAFEYLLSVLGSQGDAGQFRTPRHIIDFIVAVVDPAKHETVLDPACGTAGFLISAYKHILNNNTATPLTPDEKTKLMSNVVGYDISPDMVKLSLVNMYLHGFPGPQIHEYDTLTSEKRWGEQFDVIIANPPFMTPKGGIRPHKRFSVQASRSEVLFVDYILEHLSLNGRAGIIVPEGIIFQASNAYKQLRKMLVEDGLFAVVSLPPGVFNPYSGVKTSVLFFDNEFAKKRAEILFLKVENDGFDLGAQRREIEKNDLPEARKVIAAWKRGKKRAGDIALWIKKAKIADSGDYNLTGVRYREVEVYKNQKWPLVELGDICEIKRGTTITKKQAVVGDIPVIAGGQQPAYYHNKANRKSPVITVSGSGAYAGFVNFFNQPIYASDCSTIEPKNNGEVVDVQFIYRILKSRQDEIYQFQQGGGQPHVYPKDIQKIKIPLPPLEVQKEIVEQIEIKQNAINHAKEIIKNLERERESILARRLGN
ncbi:N-6 DNA methylase [Candidatus Spongiihabitans sp.]|uniref:N-6 DNA methylase n=1 Tax=Candidatus Spongiihabitans sp. TaxID=3101308 RepID=UPI003C70535B